MKYMLLLNSDPVHAPDPDSQEAQDMMARWFSYSDELVAAGAMVSGEALLGADSATVVTVRNGERVVTDGPFIESKEVLGGYYVIDVVDLDAALDWAAKIPNVHIGSVEVRPVMQLPES